MNHTDRNCPECDYGTLLQLDGECGVWTEYICSSCGHLFRDDWIWDGEDEHYTVIATMSLDEFIAWCNEDKYAPPPERPTRIIVNPPRPHVDSEAMVRLMNKIKEILNNDAH